MRECQVTDSKAIQKGLYNRHAIMAEVFKEEEEPDEYEHDTLSRPREQSLLPNEDDAVEYGSGTQENVRSSQNDMEPTNGGGVNRPTPRREKNKDFKDVETTGKWGQISRKDMIIVVIVFLAVAGGVTAAVVLGTKGSPAPAPRTPAPTPAPTIPPDIAPELQFPVILQAIESNTFLNVSDLSNDLAYYQDPANRALAKNELEKAMFWSIIDDPFQPTPDSPWLIPRFALAAFYYATGGEQWTTQSNWLTIASVCDWHGIYCDRFRNSVREVDQTGNNLVGTIPDSLNMLSTLLALTVTQNQLVGTVPWLALGSIPSLSILAANDNILTGSMSGDIRANGVLTTLLLQKNLLTGEWPRVGLCDGTTPLLSKWSVDCEEIIMRTCRCCQDDLAQNCF